MTDSSVPQGDTTQQVWIYSDTDKRTITFHIVTVGQPSADFTLTAADAASLCRRIGLQLEALGEED